MLIQESAVERQLYRTNPWWEDGYALEHVFDRLSAMNRLIRLLHSRSIVFLTGLRRIGKTTLMRMLVRHCIDTGLFKPEAVLYVRRRRLHRWAEIFRGTHGALWARSKF
jgi:predicted AAA+ superfamily ATPase